MPNPESPPVDQTRDTAETKKLWRETPWAWEFEVITLLLLVGGLVFSVRYEWMNTPIYAKTSDVIQDETAQSTWVILSVLAYSGHLLLSRVAIRDVSTPFHLIMSPTLFTVLGFFNFRGAFIRAHGPENWSWPTQGFAILISLILVISFLLARLRMQRVMLPFRRMRWDIDVAPSPSSSNDWGALLARIHPVIYPPVRFRANASGIEIEGPYYVSLVSFREISAITHHPQGKVAAAGVYLTRGMRDLVAIHLKTRQEPIVINPMNATAFAAFTAGKLRTYNAEHSIKRNSSTSLSD